MLDNSEKTKAQLAMERLGRPISSYRRSANAVRTISYVDKNRLDRAIEPKIKQNELERRESELSARGKVIGPK